MINEVILGDCLDVMPKIPDDSVDMVLCDLPYGVTNNIHDVIIDPASLWANYWRIVKDSGVVVLFGQDKFTATMMLSDKNHRYNLVWDKVLSSGFLNANRMPLRSHEDIMVFYRYPPTYNPQKIIGQKNHSRGALDKNSKNNNYGEYAMVETDLGNLKHPKSIISVPKPHPSVSLHRTEKPTRLLEYLIKTYTNEGEVVLDNCAGSGTTGLACRNTGRNFILIEKDPTYYETCKQRVAQQTLFNS